MSAVASEAMSDKPIRTARGFAARGVVERGQRTGSTAVGRSPLDRLSAAAPTPVGATRTPELDALLSPEIDDASSRSWGIDTTPGWLAPERERPRRLDGREGLRANGFDDERRDDLDPDLDEDEDEYRPRRRFAVAPAGAIALILVGVIACVIAGFGLLRNDDVVPTVAFPASAGPSASIPAASVPSDAAAPSAAAPAMPSAAAPSAASAQIVVSVVGLVRKPGLVRLAPQSRVADALSSAGGAREGADTTSLNLAQVLGDGDQVLVGYASKDGNASLRSAVVAAGVGEAGLVVAADGRSCIRVRRWHNGFGVVEQHGRKGRPEHRERRATRRSPRGRPGDGEGHHRLAFAARKVHVRRPTRRGGWHRTGTTRQASRPCDRRLTPRWIYGLSHPRSWCGWSRCLGCTGRRGRCLPCWRSAE